MHTLSTHTPGWVELVRTWRGACRSLISGPVSIPDRSTVVSSSLSERSRSSTPTPPAAPAGVASRSGTRAGPCRSPPHQPAVGAYPDAHWATRN
eukprot:3517226-Pyramimonas_sp.AAC.1